MRPTSTKHIFLGTIAVLIILTAIIFGHSLLRSDSLPPIPDDKWQAVFLENGQVYFGKLSDINSTYANLTDVFYLRAGDTLGVDNASQNINLVKLGGEFHRPDDTIYIPKAKILFWENLTNESPVVKTIINSKK